MSVLDHVFYKGLPTPSFAILPHALTDHRPTLARFDLQFGRVGLRRISRRNFRSISTAAICCAINAEALSTVFAMDDVEEIHDIIISEITAALDLVAPLEQVQIKDRTNSLYLSSETRAAIRQRDMAADRGNHASYRTLRNRAARLVRRDKLASNARYLQEKEYNPKAIWQLANTAAGRSIKSAFPSELVDEESGDKIRGDVRLADCVNKYYITKITKIRERIDNDLDVHGLATQQQQKQQQQQQQQQRQKSPRFQFRAPTEREVLAAIYGLNNTQALGIDGIPVSVLKQLAPIIALPAAHLVKTSFENALVPTGFKRASVIPLHKKNKPTHMPSSFRPVAILPAFSKVMERLVLQQVSPHLASLLPPSQFGFRPRRSTAAAISYAHGSWAAAKARGLIVAVAGYDLSAAFDTIDVNMVSNKLEDFGVMDKENQWFHDYLSGRKQQVQYNGCRSTYRNVEHGVPQGSILGPLLFLTLVADLPSRLLPPEDVSGVSDVEVGFSAYADDALCWAAGKDVSSVKCELERLSETIVDYTNQNYLALNEAKTQVIWFSSKSAPIKVGKCLVHPTDRLEVLGVTFDKLLSPSPHMNSLITATRSVAAMARWLAIHLPSSTMKIVMGALLRGKVGYSCQVLPPRFSSSDPTNVLMQQIQVGINNVARATLKTKKTDRTHVEDLLSEAGLPSLNRLVIYTIAMECWRALSLRDGLNCPLNPLGTLLSPPTSTSSTIRTTRTRAVTSGCLLPPAKQQVQSFTWWAYTCWNSSPPLRSAQTVSAAKKAAIELAAAAPF